MDGTKIKRESMLSNILGYFTSLSFSPPLKLTEQEQQIKTVVEKLIHHQESKFRLAPESQDIVVKNKEFDYFLLLRQNRISISNHSFLTDHQYRLTFVDYIREIIYKKMEHDRQVAINEIFENERNLLNTIIEKL